MKRILLPGVMLLLFQSIMAAPGPKSYELKSPDGKITVTIVAGPKLLWSARMDGRSIIEPSPVSIALNTGEIIGNNISFSSVRTEKINTSFKPVNYFRNEITDLCTQVTFTSSKAKAGIIFRVYNDAVAYRLFTQREGDLTVKNEEASFLFSDDFSTFVPIQWDYRDRKIFNSSFEALYRHIRISEFPKDSLAFLPALVDLGSGLKVEILESDLEDYPGMYLDRNSTGNGFKGVFAPYPLETYIKGLNVIPSKRADYIARTKGTRTFPWRVAVISRQDRDLLGCDIIQKLAAPSRLNDISWIKPGQVSWDWWNSLNISHVDFRAGMNTATYKYYIDFAAKCKAPYIIIDADWNVPGDLSKPIKEINLEELVAYGNQKGVGIIVWASWQDVLGQKEKVFPLYSKMGIKGMKIDFFDRDDQVVVASTYEIAKLAAENHLLVDFHGIYKPTGLQRTYPNVIGYEGVKGMENVKWAWENVPAYDVSIPFIRNVAGPMDYTPGAMRNSNQQNFRPVNDMPMSKGTRVHQMAMYTVFFAPLQMLSDNPTVYMKEQECTDFITSVPTTFDETVPLDGKTGEYVAVARKKSDTWYVGAMTNWTPREIELDFSFLGEGNWKAEIFSDGINADRDATDYKKETKDINKGDRLTVKLMNGGGWTARIERK